LIAAYVTGIYAAWPARPIHHRILATIRQSLDDRDGIMFPILRNQDFGTVKALQSQHNQTLFLVGRHHDFSV